MPKRPAGWKHSEEARAKISQAMVTAHRARSPVHHEHHRSKIETGKIIKRLHSVGLGKVEANPVAVTACIALLRKVLPDLASVEHKHDAMVTLRTIITGVIRQEDLQSSPPVTKTIDHEPSD